MTLKGRIHYQKKLFNEHQSLIIQKIKEKLVERFSSDGTRKVKNTKQEDVS